LLGKRKKPIIFAQDEEAFTSKNIKLPGRIIAQMNAKAHQKQCDIEIKS
jgi:hypothetical protein